MDNLCDGSPFCESVVHHHGCPMLTVDTLDRPDHDSDDCFDTCNGYPGIRTPRPKSRPSPPPNGDPVQHPSHYADRVPGIECIEVAQHFNFNRGNAIKYLWRAGAKANEIEDLRKARQYIEFEIARLGGSP